MQLIFHQMIIDKVTWCTRYNFIMW